MTINFFGLRLFAPILCVIMLFGCTNRKSSTPDGEKARMTGSSWRSRPTSKFMSSIEMSDYVKKDCFFEINETDMDRAIGMLEKRPCVLLSKVELELFVTDNQERLKMNLLQKKLKPYLIRSLTTNIYLTGYLIALKNNSILISSSTMGKGSPIFKKQALIVFLKEMPRKVYITCSSAE